MDRSDVIVISGFLIFLALLVWLAATSENDARIKWAAFKVEHKCKLIGHKDSQTGTGFGPTYVNGRMGVGMTTTTIPEQYGWQCDDGMQYWNRYKN